jgi:hypothetical protein
MGNVRCRIAHAPSFPAGALDVTGWAVLIWQDSRGHDKDGE